MSKLVIIGGGASGLAAAIAAACTISASGPLKDSVEVELCEVDDRVGKSILVTGNGRCNFSNAHNNPNAYWNSPFVQEVFAALERTQPWGTKTQNTQAKPPQGLETSNAVLTFFYNLNLVWREESEGRLYPAANKASVVVDVLRSYAQALGVKECCKQQVLEVFEANKGYSVLFSSGQTTHADAIIVACGGKGIRELKLPEASSQRYELQPVLGPLRVVESPLVKPLDNIRVRCCATLMDSEGKPLASEPGEVLFRAYGVSGIAIFNLSRFVFGKNQALELDFIPTVAQDEAPAYILKRAQRCMQLGFEPTADVVLRGLLLPKVIQSVVKVAKINAHQALCTQEAEVLAQTLKHFTLHVAGIGDERQCQVMRGGLVTELFDSQTLESKANPRIFACGEALDVDAQCGGFNLHWAWASGLLAGVSAAREVCSRL
ncbi:NAD(P)/FAD-dependent oxidoreductase [Adlercreutzia agrestimuris]|uniref:NAD(P)/FAD-dependent oxidoreductase n=1 Tax=Adlercreutzia agrestimuris TaxID=2941324 RepID=UPI002041247D|nr:NAD(P)/FAD-dependent oxidoreductase [Adlercreutzia agrestimuris]